MNKQFQRRIEDFVCEHCGAQIEGTGFTNHCPHCLWSKHVDVNPGDRAELCLGMMEPIQLIGSTPHYRIVHKCNKCGFERVQNTADDDDANAIIMLAGRRATIET